jgi:chromosome segregation ATPase
MGEGSTSILLDVLQIVVPALLIVGGGALGYWKYLQDKASKQGEIWGDFKLQAEQAAWERVKHTIDMQAERIDDQDKRIEILEESVNTWKGKFSDAIVCIEELENKFGECEKVREMLEEKNAKLELENQRLKKN